MAVSSGGNNKPSKMGTLQKFKLLATQCGMAQSPTRSPRTSPLIQLRRRKPTLLMLLSRSSGSRSSRRDPPVPSLPEKEAPAVQRRSSLMDLFVSSPPIELNGESKSECIGRREFGGFMMVGPGSPRPGWIGFRYKSLLRRAWRPVLVAIPE